MQRYLQGVIKNGGGLAKYWISTRNDQYGCNFNQNIVEWRIIRGKEVSSQIDQFQCMFEISLINFQ